MCYIKLHSCSFYLHKPVEPLIMPLIQFNPMLDLELLEANTTKRCINCLRFIQQAAFIKLVSCMTITLKSKNRQKITYKDRAEKLTEIKLLPTLLLKTSNVPVEQKCQSLSQDCERQCGHLNSEDSIPNALSCMVLLSLYHVVCTVCKAGLTQVTFTCNFVANQVASDLHTITPYDINY